MQIMPLVTVVASPCPQENRSQRHTATTPHRLPPPGITSSPGYRLILIELAPEEVIPGGRTILWVGGGREGWSGRHHGSHLAEHIRIALQVCASVDVEGGPGDPPGLV